MTDRETRRKYRCPCGGEFNEWDGPRGDFGPDKCPFCGIERHAHDGPDEELEQRVSALESVVKKLYTDSAKAFSSVGEELRKREF